MNKSSIKKMVGACLAFGMVAGSPAVADTLPMEPYTAPEISISGTYLGGLNFLSQHINSGGNRRQFDYALNLDFEATISEKITAFAQLQTSPGNGVYGFPGPGAELTDVGLEYACHDSGVTVVAGSFDTPFGQQTAMLTNNADTFNNSLIVNPLLYSAFAGPAGTLNTLGVMGSYGAEWGATTLAVSNGTDESANNGDESFEFVISQTIEVLGGSFGGSYMSSDDASNAGSGFGAAFSGWIVDAVQPIGDNTEVVASYAQLRYGDNDSATKDDVTAYTLEATQTISDWFFSARYSTWRPEDGNGSGAGMSPTMPNPGFDFAGTMLTDVDVTRYEFGVGYVYDENIVLKAEWVSDVHSVAGSVLEGDVNGIIAVVNARF